MEVKNQFINSLLVGSLFFYSLDAYSFFDVPFSWIGLSGIFLIAIFSDYKILLNSKLYLIILILLMPTFFNNISTATDLNFILRLFNTVSFFVVLLFSLKFFDNSQNTKFINLLQKLILVLSIFAIYLYLAQIYDLPEIIRNRSNTGLLGDSSQTTFWKNEPHRMVGSFREPVLLASTLLPLYFLYLLSARKLHLITVILSSIVIGLTRSDLVRIYCFITLLVLLVFYIKTKELNKAIFPVCLVLLFSLTGVRECDLNPDSSDCITSDTISTEVETLVFSDLEKTFKIGDDRNSVLDYAIYSFRNLVPKGVTKVNADFSSYLSQDISNEMYLTNRTLPEFLLTRYEAKNFGTGNYSLLRYYPNVQNLFINASLSLGAAFISFMFLVILHLFTSLEKNVSFYLFFLLALFFLVTPVEEFNAFTALVLGAGFNMIISKKEISQ
jgi:hypothetical protein